MKTIKLTVGIKSEHTSPPIFMEGEAPGVFAIQTFEIKESDMEKPMFARWILEQEDEMIADVVECKWEELTNDLLTGE